MVSLVKFWSATFINHCNEDPEFAATYSHVFSSAYKELSTELTEMFMCPPDLLGIGMKLFSLLLCYFLYSFH